MRLPSDQPEVQLALRDAFGSDLTVQVVQGERLDLDSSVAMCGIAVSNRGENPGIIHMDRADRASLIATLIALQEDEDLL